MDLGCTETRQIISHIRTSDMELQSNDEHQINVANRAKHYASNFRMGDIAYIMGMLHDKGKEQEEWQKYIQGVTGYDLKYSNIKTGPHHAYVGAIIAEREYPQIASLIAQPIAGHHRGLYDVCDYDEIKKQNLPSDISTGEKIDYIFPADLNIREKYDYHNLVRMLFSCLVDADSLDTESFMTPEQSRLRGSRTTMGDLLKRLESYLQKLRSQADDTEVNRIRNFVQEECIKQSQNGKGFYSLTVPTGGGKTLSSVLWALHHAVKNNLNRIIIAIPYTSIIVQTAATLKKIFGEDNVLEHHSCVDFENINDREFKERMQLATENWDYPIIVTTNVQFFESLFSNKRSDCRKIHNITNSVIILDEVQTLPLGFYKPIVNTLDTLHRIFGASVLFTTASQPILEGRIEGTNPYAGFMALQSIQEIIPEDADLHNKLRRVELEFIQKSCSYDDLATELAKHKRVLCIVNTRRDAKEIYNRIPKDGLCLHLSRMMCPAHISITIQKIKDALKKDDITPIRVIATQLIEAGVDIDFPVVYRQEAGLDSILQAAGRCNREGKLESCSTYVFSLSQEHTLPPGHITQTNNARLAIGTGHDWFSPKTMISYFKQLHSRVNSFDEKKMQDLLYKTNCEFEEAAKQFQLINDRTISVIINWKDSMDLYNQLKTKGPSYSLIKKLTQYSVNIVERDFNELKSIGVIEEFFENIYAITASGFYTDETGLSTQNRWAEETFII